MSYGSCQHGIILLRLTTLTCEATVQRMPASGIHPMCMACFSARALYGPTSYFHVPMEIHPVVHYCRDDMISVGAHPEK